jgi:hypothetical protein
LFPGERPSDAQRPFAAMAGAPRGKVKNNPMQGRKRKYSRGKLSGALTPAEPLQHHARTLTCRHAGEFQIAAGENVPRVLDLQLVATSEEIPFGNRIGPLISFLRSSSTTMPATDAGLSSDIANTAQLRGCALQPQCRAQAKCVRMASITCVRCRIKGSRQLIGVSNGWIAN